MESTTVYAYIVKSLAKNIIGRIIIIDILMLDNELDRIH